MKKFFKSTLNISLGLFVLFFYQNCGQGFETGSLSSESSILSVSIPPLTWSVRPEVMNNNQIQNFQVALSAPYNRGVEYYCKVDMAPMFSACSNQISLKDMTDGVHELSVKAIDVGNNNIESPVARYSWTQDRGLPLVTINQAPPAVLGLTQAQVTFSTTDTIAGVNKIECALDTAAFATCMSPVNLTNLASGAHKFSIRSIDKAGNVSLVSEANFTVTLGVPTVTVSAKPNAIVNTRNSSVSFAGVDSQSKALVKYECKIGSAAYAVCTSPMTYSNQADGAYTFMVRGTDSLSRVSSDVSVVWTVDATAPAVNITSAPPATITVNTASFAFTVTDTGTGLKSTTCQLDSGAIEACTASKVYTALTAGNHIFRVVATDNANNVTTKESAFSYAAPALDGRILYANNCAGCHNAIDNSTKFNRTAAQIQGAIAVIPNMVGLKNMPAAEVSAIASALVKSTANLTNPFACNANSDPGHSNLRRLTKREFVNTLQDLFGSNLVLADISNELSTLPAETIGGIPIFKLFDTTNPNPTNLQIVTAYNDIAVKVSDLVTNSATKQNSIGGNTCLSGATPTDACVNGFIDTFGLKAYRRPITAAERAIYLTFYKTGTSAADRMARVIEAMLQSPNFIYHLEVDGSLLNGRNDLVQLSNYEVASKLAYSIWGSMPDAGLFAAAASGSLASPTGIKTQVDRMFTLARAKTGIKDFYYQWLRVDGIPNMTVSAVVAGGLNTAGFQSEAKQEIVDLMDHLIWTQKASYLSLLDTKLAYPKGANLAKVYNMTASANIQTTSDANRVGLFTRAGMLALDNAAHSNPINRGVRMRIHLLCDGIGTPPADVESSAGVVNQLDSTRDQVSSKTSPAQCTTCHTQINPIGFAFENYDGFGRYRVQETVEYNGQTKVHAINAQVVPNINSMTEPNVNGAVALQAEMAKSSKAPACMAKQYLQYSLGRDIQAGDACALSAMYDSMMKAGGSLQDMFKSLSQTTGFRTKKLVFN